MRHLTVKSCIHSSRFGPFTHLNERNFCSAVIPEDEVEDGDDGAELLRVARVGVGEVGGQHDDVQHHAQNVDQ